MHSKAVGISPQAAASPSTSPRVIAISGRTISRSSLGPVRSSRKLKDLLQTGEFAANETVTVVGQNRRVFEQVRILGPVRKITQVELSYTDGRYLGMNLPARNSGDIAGTHPIVIIGPKGALHLPEGCIRALRHVHIGEDDASRLSV